MLLCTLAGGWWFTGMVYAVAMLAAWEWGMLQRISARLLPPLGVLSALVFPVAISIHEPAFAPIAFGVLMCLGVALLPHDESASELLSAGALTVVGAIYIGALLTPSILLRDAPDGVVWVLTIILATWACDTAAYAIGRRWGRRKLAPPISPQKTVEGTVAGLVGAVAIGASMMALLPLFGYSEFGPKLVGLGLVVGLSAVGGDLLESAVKRRLGVKDAGWMLPGHGGILDRIDGLLPALSFGFLYVRAWGNV